MERVTITRATSLSYHADFNFETSSQDGECERFTISDADLEPAEHIIVCPYHSRDQICLEPTAVAEASIS